MADKDKIPFWRDSRFLRFVGQAIVILVVGVAIAILASNLVRNFGRLGLNFSFDFLSRPASFGIGDPPISYNPTEPYTRAILVGLINSLRVMFFGIIIATILGITVGMGRLSANWLVRQLATVYVETLRNTPLLLQLFFWYFAVFLRLPKIDNPVVVGGHVFLSNRGLDIPWPASNLQTWLGLGVVIFCISIGIVCWRKGMGAMEKGESGRLWLWCLGGVAIAAILVLIVGLAWELPQLKEKATGITGGLNLSPELATLLIGLSVYTAAFIAEIVRAGIQSVGKGQWEAAKALGLKSDLVMQLVIFPQALRVIIPPLTSEFLNLAKNSSLAIAIGYNDIYAISQTISNQTGRSLEMLSIVMLAYLSINLIIAAVMNWFNRLVQVKER